jgi:transcriptional regulator with XRE-family HTH domain/ABC-type dipeptide/oligopeptide/nickel transport system ATPase component
VAGSLLYEGADPDPQSIATQQDFGRELSLVRQRAGLTVREVARTAGLPASTAGDYFSGRHLPPAGQPGLLPEILAACGETDPARVREWTNALGRARRAPGRRASGARAPYRGLASFQPGDAPWFFGRAEITDRLVALASGASAGADGAAASPHGAAPSAAGVPLAVVGPSGSGKSSLLRAGLIPRLLAADGPAAGPVIVVDQFEEVFTACRDEEQRQAFIGALCALSGRVVVVLALRADFYDRALRYPELAATLQERQVVLGPMSQAQVRSAIVEPARLARLDVEDGLVEVLLRELAPRTADGGQPGAAYEAGALPLLSHALLATWEHSRGGKLTVADYQASGGIRDAIARTAEEVYAGLTDSQQDMTRRLFLRLVHVADDAPETRSTAALSDLPGQQDAAPASDLLGRFVDARLITMEADTAQITHDALLTAWPRLRAWIDTGHENLRIRRRVSESARAWAEAGRDNAALLRGSQLAVARDWAADQQNADNLSRLACEFVDASVAQQNTRQQAERSRTRRLHRLVAALTALVLVTIGLAGYAFQQRQPAAVRQPQPGPQGACGRGRRRDAAAVGRRQGRASGCDRRTADTEEHQPALRSGVQPGRPDPSRRRPAAGRGGRRLRDQRAAAHQGRMGRLHPRAPLPAALPHGLMARRGTGRGSEQRTSSGMPQDGNHVAQSTHLVVVDGVADLSAPAPGAHEPGIAQHLQMLADRGLADGKDLREVTRACLRPLGELPHHAQPHRMCQRPQPDHVPVHHAHSPSIAYLLYSVIPI